MKSPLRFVRLIWLALALGFVGTTDLSAQEEDLNRAIKDQKRRMEGLSSLTNRLKNLVYKYVPGVDAEEEAAPPESTAKVAVREVKLVMNDESGAAPAASEAAVATAAQQAQMEAEVYRQSLQSATTKLNIQGAFPKSKQIMIGAQNLGVGEEIAIKYEGHLFDLEILDITASELKLRDQKSQLELKVAIGVTRALPPGMFTSRPVGMFPTDSTPVADNTAVEDK